MTIKISVRNGGLTVVDTSRPASPGWAKAWICAERPIPETWRNYFYDELVSEDLEYRKSLEEDVRWHGVRWNKDV